MRKLMIGSFAAVLALSGCANMSETERGTAQGAGIGAGLGALIGGVGGGSKNIAGGAALGGILGAVAGNVWSSKMENQKRSMEQATKGTGVQVTQTADNRLKLEIPSDISFATGRSDINSSFRPILDRFATGLVDNQAATVTIIGHTDSTGSDAINNPLSFDRASRTRDYLAGRGVAPQRIYVDGRGSHEPIASNAGEAGRARNRRVEIYVAEQQQQPQQQQYQQQQYQQR
ncbi:OmpA family protein [Herminiimonas fonticola]|uniref:Outer membrane protein OmpA-like peptidoglycan-associated protein n=1 Tax=Herminiimonas fonticola TaxID=303380 RepID=A0A4R6GI70_9BURK|nr:OmpA family protein [Herminiimonas fonticola]RBA25510.1 Outer membrane protein and related peptidoglycan-associated (lipo)protein [Herminiimonas fonticola]TDN94623.1 outer membrane protein OmpA-like peptidoglycan-associated protein [Herminiimonas fonticola]